ncbi:hypothetical protein M885DRAFT_517414 [Pelagophyceae sp. CCMP2097]|nr:hypothetical protein M885DRAFT_517414 [Pelagophyceae sp. CCMP2097]
MEGLNANFLHLFSCGRFTDEPVFEFEGGDASPLAVDVSDDVPPKARALSLRAPLPPRLRYARDDGGDDDDDGQYDVSAHYESGCDGYVDDDGDESPYLIDLACGMDSSCSSTVQNQTMDDYLTTEPDHVDVAAPLRDASEPYERALEQRREDRDSPGKRRLQALRESSANLTAAPVPPAAKSPPPAPTRSVSEFPLKSPGRPPLARALTEEDVLAPQQLNYNSAVEIEARFQSPLHAWLFSRGLGRHYEAIGALGAKKIADLGYITRSDMDDLGLTPEERAFFQFRIAT